MDRICGSVNPSASRLVVGHHQRPHTFCSDVSLRVLMAFLQQQQSHAQVLARHCLLPAESSLLYAVGGTAHRHFIVEAQCLGTLSERYSPV